MSNTANLSETPASATRDELSADDVFDVLSVARRRTVLTILNDRQEPIDGKSLARAVASRERDATRDSVSDSAVEQVHVRLHHVHLPKLDSVGLVTYDREDGVVEQAADVDGVPINIE